MSLRRSECQTLQLDSRRRYTAPDRVQSGELAFYNNNVEQMIQLRRGSSIAARKHFAPMTFTRSVHTTEFSKSQGKITNTQYLRVMSALKHGVKSQDQPSRHLPREGGSTIPDQTPSSWSFISDIRPPKPEIGSPCQHHLCRLPEFSCLQHTEINSTCHCVTTTIYPIPNLCVPTRGSFAIYQHPHQSP